MKINKWTSKSCDISVDTSFSKDPAMVLSYGMKNKVLTRSRHNKKANNKNANNINNPATAQPFDESSDSADATGLTDAARHETDHTNPQVQSNSLQSNSAAVSSDAQELQYPMVDAIGHAEGISPWDEKALSNDGLRQKSWELCLKNGLFKASDILKKKSVILPTDFVNMLKRGAF